MEHNKWRLKTGQVTPASHTTIAAIGASVGGVCFLAMILCALVTIYLRPRKSKRSVAEIEHGFSPVYSRVEEITEIPGPRVSLRRSVLQPYDPPNGWNTLSSSDTVHHIPPYAPDNDRVGVSMVCTDGQPRKGFVIRGNRIRIARISSKYRKVQPLSAIIESPRSVVKSPTAGSTRKLLTAKTIARPQDNAIMPATAVVNVATHDRTMSLPIEIPPRSLRPRKTIDLDLLGVIPLQDIDRLRAVRSKSMGTFLSRPSDESVFNDISRPDRPAPHSRSRSFGAKASGPAPTGPLPPLPSLASLTASKSQPIFLDNTFKVASNQDGNKGTATGSGSEKNWERIVNPEVVNGADRTRALDDTRRLLENSRSDPQLDTSSDTKRPRSLYSTALRNSAHLSMQSTTSNRDSISSIASSLNKDDDRLSIPQIKTADRVSMSRVSSYASLNSSNSVQVVKTPRRRPVSRVSIYGSPGERTKTSALKSISGNASNSPRHASVLGYSPSKPNNDSMPFQWDTPSLPIKPSALKGSPGARKGHKRQNCVRISTLAPKILGPRSRSSSPALMDEILEESPDGKRPLSGPVADRHINGDVTLRPQSSSSCLHSTILRASLTPSSPTLSMATFYRERTGAAGGPNSGPNSRRASYSPMSAKPSLSRDSSLFSIPTFPSPSHEDLTAMNVRTPAIAFTRPSFEWNEENNSPPFALKVTPSGSMPSLYDDEKLPLPHVIQAYDLAWPTQDIRAAVASTRYNPPASGQDYDPTREIAVYSSPESSSPTFPFTTEQYTASKRELLQTRKTPSPVSPLSSNQSPFSPSDYLSPSPVSPLSPQQSSFPASAYLCSSSPALSTLPTPPSSRTTNPNHNRGVLPSATTLVSPLTSIPVLKPLPLSYAKALPRPATSPPQDYVSPDWIDLPAVPPRSAKRLSKSLTNSGVAKSRLRTHTLSGPRPSPPKDLRRSVQALRRMNSDLGCEGDGVSVGGRRYLRLGREGSVILPFDFEIEGGGSQPKNDKESGKMEDKKKRESFDFGFTDAGAADDLDVEMADYDVLDSAGHEGQEADEEERKENRDSGQQKQQRYRAYSPLRHSHILSPLREEETQTQAQTPGPATSGSTHAHLQTAMKTRTQIQIQPPSLRFPSPNTSATNDLNKSGSRSTKLSRLTTAAVTQTNLPRPTSPTITTTNPSSPTLLLEDLLSLATATNGSTVTRTLPIPPTPATPFETEPKTTMGVSGKKVDDEKKIESDKKTEIPALATARCGNSASGARHTSAPLGYKEKAKRTDAHTGEAGEVERITEADDWQEERDGFGVGLREIQDERGKEEEK